MICWLFLRLLSYAASEGQITTLIFMGWQERWGLSCRIRWWIVNWHDSTRYRSLVGVGVVGATVWLDSWILRILVNARIHNGACLHRWLILRLRLSYKLRSRRHSIRSLGCITCWTLFLRQIWPNGVFLLNHHILTAFKWWILHWQLSHSWSDLRCASRWLLLWHY